MTDPINSKCSNPRDRILSARNAELVVIDLDPSTNPRIHQMCTIFAARYITDRRIPEGDDYQMAWMALQKASTTYDGRGSIYAHLWVKGHHLLIDELRDVLGTRRVYGPPKIVFLEDPHNPGFQDDGYLQDDSWRVRMETREGQLWVGSIIDQVCGKYTEKWERYRRVLYLKFVLGLTMKRCGDVEGLTESRVSQIIKKFLPLIRRRIRESNAITP